MYWKVQAHNEHGAPLIGQKCSANIRSLSNETAWDGVRVEIHGSREEILVLAERVGQINSVSLMRHGMDEKPVEWWLITNADVSDAITKLFADDAWLTFSLKGSFKSLPVPDGESGAEASRT